MKDSVDPPSMRDELEVCLRLKSEDDCLSSWRTLTSCQVSLPLRSGLTIRAYGGSGTDQVLFQSIVDRPINIIGQIGQIPWNPSFQLLTMVSIVIAVGQTEFILDEVSVPPNCHLEWYVYRRPTRDHGSLPRNRVRISGANRICGTTFITEAEVVGSITSFAFAIRVITSAFAKWGPGTVRLLRSIYRVLATVSPVTLLGRCFGVTRDC
jgi:hypothetical protein